MYQITEYSYQNSYCRNIHNRRNEMIHFIKFLEEINDNVPLKDQIVCKEKREESVDIVLQWCLFVVKVGDKEYSTDCKCIIYISDVLFSFDIVSSFRDLKGDE